MNLRCRIGLHSLGFVAPFERKCERCGAEFCADYFDWRAKGYAVWRRVNPKPTPATGT